MQIQIKREKPPEWIYKRAKEMFEVDDQDTIYTYGNTIFDPRTHYVELAPSIIEHEKKHMEQQQGMETTTEHGPDRWWRKYFEDVEFRRNQEIEAYRAQYRHAKEIYKDRNDRARYLDIIATFASSPLYKLGLTKSQALSLIRN